MARCIDQACVCAIVLVASVLEVVAYSFDTYYLMDHCDQVFSMNSTPSIIMRLTPNTTYSPKMECETNITASTGYRLMLRFLDVSMDAQCEDYVYILEPDWHSNRAIAPVICKGHTTEKYVTSGSTGILGFRSNSDDAGPGFSVVITLFRTGSCRKRTENECKNGRCINSSLWCSGYDNCGDNSNNKDCDGVSVYSLLSLAATVGFFSVTCFYIKQKTDRRWTTCSGSRDCPTMPSCPQIPECPKLRIPLPAFLQRKWDARGTTSANRETTTNRTLPTSTSESLRVVIIGSGPNLTDIFGYSQDTSDTSVADRMSEISTPRGSLESLPRGQFIGSIDTSSPGSVNAPPPSYSSLSPSSPTLANTSAVEPPPSYDDYVGMPGQQRDCDVPSGPPPSYSESLNNT